VIEKDLSYFNSQFLSFIQNFYKDDRKIAKACRYALEGQGKRVRPLLVLRTHRLFSDQIQNAIPAAIAVEMLHTYSLVHDDLPVMDNDDYRRGRLTVHKVYDEATALLVGDALLTDAFYCLAGGFYSYSRHPEQSRGISPELMIRELAQAAGSLGMVHGQSLDLDWTARSGYSLEDVLNIHTNKTAKLFGVSCALGAVSGQGTAEDVFNLRQIGEDFGLAFQIMDDLIDDHKGTGKSSGKDKSAGKLTYLMVMSSDEAQKKVSDLMQSIDERLASYGVKSEALREYVRGLTHRRV
jgi:geranylgeranyl pyrophosphate synthase